MPYPFVQTVANFPATAGPSGSITLTAAVPIGYTILIHCTISGGNTLTSMSDTKSNTYTIDTQVGTNNRRDSIISCFVTTALTTSDSISFISSSTGIVAFDAFMYYGLQGPVDKVNNANVTTGTGPLATGSTGTLTQANELAITGAGSSSFQTWTNPSGWNDRGGGVLNIRTVDQLVSSTTALNPSWSWNTSAATAVVIATYKVKAQMYSGFMGFM